MRGQLEAGCSCDQRQGYVIGIGRTRVVWGGPLNSVNPVTVKMGPFTSIVGLWETLVQNLQAMNCDNNFPL